MADKNKIASLYGKILQNLKNITTDKQKDLSQSIEFTKSSPVKQDKPATRHEASASAIIEPKVQKKVVTSNHDKMLANELSLFRKEVESKYLKSSTNIAYKYPFSHDKENLKTLAFKEEKESTGLCILITSYTTFYNILHYRKEVTSVKPRKFILNDIQGRLQPIEDAAS